MTVNAVHLTGNSLRRIIAKYCQWAFFVFVFFFFVFLFFPYSFENEQAKQATILLKVYNCYNYLVHEEHLTLILEHQAANKKAKQSIKIIKDGQTFLNAGFVYVFLLIPQHQADLIQGRAGLNSNVLFIIELLLYPGMRNQFTSVFGFHLTLMFPWKAWTHLFYLPVTVKKLGTLVSQAWIEQQLYNGRIKRSGSFFLKLWLEGRRDGFMLSLGTLVLSETLTDL